MGNLTAYPHIAENLERVRESIDKAAGGRAVDLVCVSKYASDEEVHALLEAGATHLGENLLPNGADRFDSLMAEGYKFKRHLIGAQQSRKMKMIPGHFDIHQAVDRMKTAVMLNELLVEEGLVLDCLLQVNIACEPQKHGFEPEEAESAFCEIHEKMKGLRLRGLMAVPPWPNAYASEPEFEKGTRGYFSKMRSLFDKICSIYPGVQGLDVLSLGMSLDYIWAIEEGATMVRVGSALFEGESEG